jgi:hypothetical protein
MKTISKTLLAGILLFSISAFSIQHFWRGKTMSAAAATERWGSTPFDAEGFREGDAKTRASMAASIQKRAKEFKGKSVLEIREMLGPTDGFYFSDVNPTYLVQIGKDRTEETWQLVFLLNSKRLVEDIIIHKNCCD